MAFGEDKFKRFLSLLSIRGSFSPSDAFERINAVMNFYYGVHDPFVAFESSRAPLKDTTYFSHRLDILPNDHSFSSLNHRSSSTQCNSYSLLRCSLLRQMFLSTHLSFHNDIMPPLPHRSVWLMWASFTEQVPVQLKM